MATYWEIRVVDGLSVVCETKMPGSLSEKEICEVLRRICCQFLTVNEICEGSYRRGTVGRNTLLEARRELKLITIGENPHVTAERKICG